MEPFQIDNTNKIEAAKVLCLFVLAMTMPSLAASTHKNDLSFPMARLRRSTIPRRTGTGQPRPDPDSLRRAASSSRARHSLGLACGGGMCSQEYISVECDVCGTEYSCYRPRRVGFERCTDMPCQGLRRYTTPMQGGTCASCIMVEKRAEQDLRRGPVAAAERKGSGYAGY
jgi:hypothetical protein